MGLCLGFSGVLRSEPGVFGTFWLSGPAFVTFEPGPVVFGSFWGRGASGFCKPFGEDARLW